MYGNKRNPMKLSFNIILLLVSIAEIVGWITWENPNWIQGLLNALKKYLQKVFTYQFAAA